MKDAVASAKAQAAAGTTFGTGLCLQRVRLAFGIAALYPDAYSAWRGAGGSAGPNTHTSTDSAPPKNVPLFWRGGPHAYGHIAISAGDGTCWSTDIGGNGHWAHVRITDIHRKWGLTYLGWSETLNGVRVHPHVTYPW